MQLNLIQSVTIITDVSVRSSAWIERWPPEPKVTGSNPVGRVIVLGGNIFLLTLPKILSLTELCLLPKISEETNNNVKRYS
jgi:hypothetical protein